MVKIALIRSGIVDNVIVSDLAFAQTLGYDAAVDVSNQRVAPGYLWNGSVFSPPPPDPVVVNATAIRKDIAEAAARLRAYRALSSPTNAQRLAFEDDLCTLLLRMGRLLLEQFDGTD